MALPSVKFPQLVFAAILMLPLVGGTQETAAAGPALTAGDAITVHLYDFPDIVQQPVQIHVGADGNVHLPYAGTIKAVGLSPDQLQQSISQALQTRGIVKEPNVTVEVTASSNFAVSVIGEVMKPALVPLFAPAPVSYVISQVGGVTGMASPRVTILHPGGVEPTSLTYDRTAPQSEALYTMVKPGDIVNVSATGVYYIAGEVNRPGIYPVTGGLGVGTVTNTFGVGVTHKLTLLGALTQAGGITAIAARAQLRLLRTVDGKREEIKIDQVKLYKGEIADPLIEPDDIIYVPSSYIRQQTNNLFGTAISAAYAAAQLHTFQ